jgi:hypothetical protein
MQYEQYNTAVQNILVPYITEHLYIHSTLQHSTPQHNTEKDKYRNSIRSTKRTVQQYSTLQCGTLQNTCTYTAH